MQRPERREGGAAIIGLIVATRAFPAVSAPLLPPLRRFRAPSAPNARPLHGLLHPLSRCALCPFPFSPTAPFPPHFHPPPPPVPFDLHAHLPLPPRCAFALARPRASRSARVPRDRSPPPQSRSRPCPHPLCASFCNVGDRERRGDGDFATRSGTLWRAPETRVATTGHPRADAGESRRAGHSRGRAGACSRSSGSAGGGKGRLGRRNDALDIKELAPGQKVTKRAADGKTKGGWEGEKARSTQEEGSTGAEEKRMGGLGWPGGADEDLSRSVQREGGFEPWRADGRRPSPAQFGGTV